MSAFANDLRYGLRALGKNPGFSLVAIAVLALGIGASTLMFAVVRSVLLRPLRFGEPENLVAIRLSSGARISDAYFQEWRLRNSTLEDMTGWFDARASFTGDSGPSEVDVDHTTEQDPC